MSTGLRIESVAQQSLRLSARKKIDSKHCISSENPPTFPNVENSPPFLSYKRNGIVSLPETVGLSRLPKQLVEHAVVSSTASCSFIICFHAGHGVFRSSWISAPFYRDI